MASEWPSVRLGDICALRGGSAFKRAYQGRASGDFPFIKVSDMNLAGNEICIRGATNWVDLEDLAPLKASPLPNGTVVFAKIGEGLRQNRVRRLTRDTVIDNNMMGAVPREDAVLPEYLYYAMAQIDLASVAYGTALPYLTAGSVEGLTVPLPPLPEQRAIAHILGTLDDKIDNNRRMSATLEEMARALYKAWFVDFEPVRAKMAGRPSASAPGDLADLFPDRLVPSEVGEIPEGWRVGRIANLASIRGGKQLPTSECGATGMYPVFGANGMMGFANRSTHEGFVIAFGRVGAYCGSVHWTYSGAWINNNASAVVPHAYPEYVLEVMLDTDFVTMRTGSAQPFIPNSALASLAVLDPSSEVRRAFCDSVRQALLRRDALAAQSRTLGELRDTLLPTLVSGEVRIAEPERFGEGVM